MTHCIKCHRPLKRPTETGMGPVCAKGKTPPPVYERDLFGYDVDRAIAVAGERMTIFIESLAIDVHMAVRRAFRHATVRRMEALR